MSGPTGGQTTGQTTAERLPFFVCGTLRPGQRHHGWALRGRIASEEPARLPGAVLYEGPGYPYAVAAPPGEGVRGELVYPDPAHYAEVLATLDRLEGYRPGAPGNHHERVAVRVVRADGRATRAWTYLAADPRAATLRASGTRIPGGSWPAAG
ncbi:gamma-glutamylcyclotransferase family protein [Streptomyces sp. 6N223]|uniref:gamma-glutamylcyclotransferase family protein n=1 Tax=Streptomyces sp. 6N223 TaxID=3457412 RepID=UPI003FCF9ACA